MAMSIWGMAATGMHPWPSTKSAHSEHGNEETAGGRRYTVPSVESTYKYGLAGTGANVATVKRGRWQNNDKDKENRNGHNMEGIQLEEHTDANSRDTDGRGADGGRGNHATQAQRPDATGTPDPGTGPGPQDSGLPLQTPEGTGHGP